MEDKFKKRIAKILGCDDCIGRRTNCPGPICGECPDEDEKEDIRDWNDIQHDNEED